MTYDTPDINRHPSRSVWREVDQYFRQALTGEDEVLITAREASAQTTLPHAEVAPNQGAFLALLTKISGARRVLEIGCLAGYSAIWFARAVGESGQVVTLELEETNAAVAQANFERAGVADRVQIILGPAADSAQQLIDAGTEPFDLVFIDADKRSNPVYLTRALELTRSGAVMVIDNVVRDGAVLETDSEDPDIQGIRDVVTAIENNPELEATGLQSVGLKGWDGMILLRRA